MAKAYLVGSGIASLAAAAFLIREGDFPGTDIHLFEEHAEIGGSLDAGGTPEAGYTMRGGRMFEEQFRCTYDLLGSIPSADDPATSVTGDTLAAHEQFPWDDASRLIDGDGKIIETHSMGFSVRDRVELVKCLATPESLLDGKRITDCFNEGFFTTNFWYMWCTTFAFEPWHSAIEFRRYLNRFVHLFPTFETMSGIHRTRYNQYDSIVRPLTEWLSEQGVTIHTGCCVYDLTFAPGEDTRVTGISYFHSQPGDDVQVEVAEGDLVFVTNGSMTANSTLGSNTQAPVPDTTGVSGAWHLWEKLAKGRDGFGNPDAFHGNVAESNWESFTVTATDPAFLDLIQQLSGRETGSGGLMTFTASNWLTTIVLNHQPVYPDQPEGVAVWWGYGLFPDKPGNFVGKPMTECTGQEILREVLGQLNVDAATTELILSTSTVIPCVMPYITSQFMVRQHGDRPQVIPAGSVNLAFIGQYAEVPDDVVFTVEYSIRTAWTAVAGLLKLDKQPPPVYKGQHDPRVLARALATMHRK